MSRAVSILITVGVVLFSSACTTEGQALHKELNTKGMALMAISEMDSAKKIDFEYLEQMVREGRGDEPQLLLSKRFPLGSSMATALAAAKAGGADCVERHNPDGLIQYSCRRYLTPPFKEAFLGSIEWNVYLSSGSEEKIHSIAVTRRLAGF